MTGKPIERSDDYYTILICAVRYACGRATYMPGLVTEWIMANEPKLPKGTAEIMLRGIEDQRRWYGWGQECDVRTWSKFELWLEKRIGGGKEDGGS